MNPVWKLNLFLFNIEGYGEFFSGITPPFDDKRYILDDGINSLAYGHWRI